MSEKYIHDNGDCFTELSKNLRGLAKIFLCPCRPCSTAGPTANSLPCSQKSNA